MITSRERFAKQRMLALIQAFEKARSPPLWATGRRPAGFTDEERVAMRARLQELKADAGQGGLEKRPLLGKIGLQPDRTVAERLHAIIKANAPALSPKT